MTRSARATLLIFAILWQTLVWLTPWGQEHRVSELANTMAHAQATAHHHHIDLSLHIDNHLTDTAHHHHANETFQLMGLLPANDGFVLDRSRSTRFLNSTAPITAVFLEGLLRPPQPTAA